jgi:disulfide oxidoreductase YuzD
VKTGELVVFGSASLAFWLANAPTSRDVDLWGLLS